MDGRVEVDRVMRQMFSGEVDWRRREPASSLDPLPDPQTAVPVLVESAQSEDATTRLRGLEGLAHTDAAGHVDRFIMALSDPDPRIQEFARRTLEALEPEWVFDHVMNILCSPDPAAAATIDKALPFLRDAIEKRMILVLEAEDEPVVRKRAAAYGLGRMDSVAGIAVLAKCAFSPYADLALQSAQALLGIRDPVVIPRLVELTGHGQAEIRGAALQRIADFGGQAGIRALTDVAAGRTGADAMLCDRAVALLNAIQDEQVIACLIEAMSSNPAVTRAAVTALRRMTGEDAGNTAAEWAQWYQRRQQPAVSTVGPTPPGKLRIIVPAPGQIETMGE